MHDPAMSEHGFLPATAEGENAAMERARTETKTVSGVRRRLRRVSVSVGALSNSMRNMGMATSTDDRVVRMYRALLNRKPAERTDSDVQLLCELLQGIKFLAKLERTHLEAVCRAIELKTYRARGLCIVRQGDVGTAFFILLRGAVSIYVNNETTERTAESGLGFLVGRCLAGESFGELALTSDKPTARNASVVTDEATDCLVLSKESYRDILAHDREAQLRSTASFLRRVPSLKHLPPEGARKLAEVLQRRVLSVGHVIHGEGSPVDRLKFMVLIKRGQCEVLKCSTHSPAVEAAEAAAETAALPAAARHKAQRQALARQRRGGDGGGSNASTARSPVRQALPVPPRSVVLCTLAPGQVVVDAVAMRQFENVGKRTKDAVGGLSELTVRALTRVELLTLSRYDYSRLVWPYVRCHTAVKRGMIEAPSHQDVAMLVRSSQEWERYKKRLLVDVVLKNQRRKFKPLARGTIPTHQSVLEAAAVTTAGSPGKLDKAALLRRKRAQRQRRLNKRLAQLRRQGAAAWRDRAKTPALPVHPARAVYMHTQAGATAKDSSRLPFAKVFGRRGALAFDQLSPKGKATHAEPPQPPAGGRHTQAANMAPRVPGRQRRSGRRASGKRGAQGGAHRRPRGGRSGKPDWGSSAGRQSSSQQRQAATRGGKTGPVMMCPQWHISHSGGIGLSAEYRERVKPGRAPRPRIRLPVANTGLSDSALFGGGSRSVANVLHDARREVAVGMSAMLATPTRSSESAVRTGASPSSPAVLPRARRGFSSNPVSPRASVPSAQHYSLPAVTKAHTGGYLSDSVGMANRFGNLRVSPLVEARMLDAMGMKHMGGVKYDEHGRRLSSRSASSRPSTSQEEEQQQRKSSAVVRSHMRMQIVASGPRKRTTNPLLAALAQGAVMSVRPEFDTAGEQPSGFAGGGLAGGGLASGGLASGGLASGGLASGGLASGGLAGGGKDTNARGHRRSGILLTPSQKHATVVSAAGGMFSPIAVASSESGEDRRQRKRSSRLLLLSQAALNPDTRSVVAAAASAPAP